MTTRTITAKPFLKWAGGKTQLLTTFKELYPKELLDGKIKRYIEPFVGSGAVLFNVLQNYKIEEAFILDVNPELIITYQVIKKDADKLIQQLKKIENEYYLLEKEKRKEYYYAARNEYNNNLTDFNFKRYSKKTIERAAQVIFFNKTCYNGLFRVNKSGQFNVPFGDYKNPKICNAENLSAVSKLLKKVKIICGDYTKSKKYFTEDSFIYFDPPYRPLNSTSSFTSYSKDIFTDEDQIKLAKFYSKINKTGPYLMLSNSNPKNVNQEDIFFHELYQDFTIREISARRSINSNGNKRGYITELVITNY